MNKLSLTTAFFIGILATGGLQAKTFTCNVMPDSSGDWISKNLVFNIDDKSGAVRIFDGIVEKYSGKPVAGKLTAGTPKRTTITWTTQQVHDDYGNSSARFRFRASYYKDSGKVIIASVPDAFDKRFGGQGKCEISSDAGWAAALNSVKKSQFSARGKDALFVTINEM